MKLAVPMKIVLDCRAGLEIEEREMAVSQKEQLATKVVNVADRAALDMALKIKESIKGVEILAINFGQTDGQEALFYALARGANRGIYIENTELSYSDENLIAKGIADVLQRERPNLVLCGDRSMDSGMACVGPFIANYLSIPQITHAVNVEIDADESAIVVERRLEKGNRERLRAPLPVLVCVDPLRFFPKYVSENALLLAKRSNIQKVSGDHLKMERDVLPRTQVVKIESPRPRPKKDAIPDSSLSPAERMKLMMSGGISKRKESKVLEGASDYLAEEVFQFLKDKKIIK